MELRVRKCHDGLFEVSSVMVVPLGRFVHKDHADMFSAMLIDQEADAEAETATVDKKKAPQSGPLPGPSHRRAGPSPQSPARDLARPSEALVAVTGPTPQTPLEKVCGAIAEISNQGTCRICQRRFSQTPDYLDLCARCRHDA